eukprot:TRINITY_DN7999_c0_g1_i3.p1 TRINITY_DN7999_c0_g1~~TRINITY_DN7999_c0_g1_i3.p1  ORF type:complete len:636 (-),score=258.43 TRINITY_DN7999_c0_g1_i3:16-1923(-)
MRASRPAFGSCGTLPTLPPTSSTRLPWRSWARSVPPFAAADAKHVRIGARRLGRRGGSRGFGNARDVRNWLETARERQAKRILAERAAGRAPPPMELSREDLLGPRTLDVRSSPALAELAGLRGLGAVKAAVEQLLRLVATNAEREEAERPIQDVALNRVFLGSPGTGKTTVARIYGRIFAELGLLSKGDVVVKNPADFVGAYLGHSEANTKKILAAAAGCVLVIDEAYGLHGSGGGRGAGAGGADRFKTAVIDTLVAEVQGVPGADLCVLLLGYRDQMEEMLRDANPGLARRFQLDNAFVFEDFSDEDLLQILVAKAAKQGWTLPFSVARAAVGVLAKERVKPNFGNAGAVDNILSRAKLRFEERMAGATAAERAAATTLAAVDFLPADGAGGAGGARDPSAIFADLVGVDDGIVSWLRDAVATIEQAQRMGRDPLDDLELTFQFVGPPGTGKTTVAGRMGELFESLGLLATADVVSVSASHFSTGYIGQAGGATRRIFERAVGGVLFIDEAYRFNERTGHGYMTEVVDEIVQLLTEPAFRGKLVLILAGYEGLMDTMMRAVNPGLRSRVTQKLRFPPWGPPTAAECLRRCLADTGFRLDAGAAAALPAATARLAAAPGWASGRDVATWAARIP